MCVEAFKLKSTLVFDIAPGAARVHADMRILMENADKTDQVRAEIRFHAIGADLASRRCFSRARKKKFPNLRTYAEYLSDDFWALRLTERGSRANREDLYFGESILIYEDDDMLLFGSPRQIRMLYLCAHWIYRRFGLLHDTHSTPSITVLMMGKSSKLYKRMWQKVKEKLDELCGLPAVIWRQDLYVSSEAGANAKDAESWDETNNNAEGYHNKRKHYFSRPHLPLGGWIARLRQLSYTEETDAYEVIQGRVPPKGISTKCKEITEQIRLNEHALVLFMNGIENDFDSDDSCEALGHILSRFGHLMGIHRQNFRESVAADEEWNTFVQDAEENIEAESAEESGGELDVKEEERIAAE
uniref:Uncharacterized protein n=1 Tax=Ditylenchus dipsaci TaxID=166011 RepID=A0A915DIC5_9BILA